MPEQVIFQRSTPGKPALSRKCRLPLTRRAAHRQLPHFRLTCRDSEIIKAVYAYRALTTPQIEALLFPPKRRQTQATKSTRCQYRLKLLFHSRYLFRDEQPQRLCEGRKPLLYFLDEEGARLLATTWRVERSELDWRPKDNQVSWMFLEHHLAANDVRIAITLAAQRQGVSLERWLDEKTLKRAEMKDYVTTTSADPSGHVRHKRVAVVPDAYFALRLGNGGRGHFFLEIDLATEPSKRWQEKIKAYLAYIRSGLYQKRYQTSSLRVLTVTSGPRRLTNLKTATEKAGGGGLFWFTTFEHVAPQTMLTRKIWRKAGSEGTHQLIEGHWPVREGQPVVLYQAPAANASAG